MVDRRHYGLVPIAAEDYSGTDDPDKIGYLAVAVARRMDSFLTLFNLKRECCPVVRLFLGCVEM